MPEYDFHTLSPSDFELLVCDLLRQDLGLELKAFGWGPDGGVDLEATGQLDRVIVQCKHYRGSTFSDLKRAAVRERKKLEDLQPKKYYFATSQDLSRTQQLKLMDLLSPYTNDLGQIIAARDLNQLLVKYPRVEQNHFKLWMASVGVIERIVNSGLWERSEALMEEIQDRVKLYVATRNFAMAREMLTQKYVCVIIGAPGVGKSMLADMLALTHWEGGWQVINLPSHQIDKCWDAWSRDTRQLFYLDDVFGQTDIHERLSNDNGVTLAQLVRRVANSPKKRLVITTRTHILREAELRDEPTQRAGLKARECVVQVQDYGRLHRAKILRNHLYFSGIDRRVIRQFAKSDLPWKIIDHENFTPRLIEQSIVQTEYSGDPNSLGARMIAALDKPVLLWGPSFREVLSEPARALLLQLAAFPTEGAPLLDVRSASIRGATPIEYGKAIAQLEGSWIRITETAESAATVEFHDPSCRDFILTFINSEPEYALEVMRYSTDAAQIAQLLAYGRSRVFAEGKASLKYPGIRSAIEENRSGIPELIEEAWGLQAKPRYSAAADTLTSLLYSTREYELGLDDWIVEQLLTLGPLLSLDHDPGSHSPGLLAETLMKSRRRPELQIHFQSCQRLYSNLCWSVAEDRDWEKVVQFWRWVEASPGFVYDDSSASQIFKESFDSWLDGDMDALMDNASDEDQASTWLSQSEELAEKYFGHGAFSSTFDYYRERIDERWGNQRDPSPEDIEAMNAAQAVEREDWSGSSPKSRGDTEGNDGENDEIRAMFIQLR